MFFQVDYFSCLTFKMAMEAIPRKPMKFGTRLETFWVTKSTMTQVDMTKRQFGGLGRSFCGRSISTFDKVVFVIPKVTGYD